MLSLLLTSFIAASVTTFLLIRYMRGYAKLADTDMSGPQKFHSRPVPRVGGVGIVVGVAAGLFFAALLRRPDSMTGFFLLGCSAPALLAGLAEDLTKSQSPRRRLFFTAVSAGIAVWALGAVIRRTDIPGVDWLVTYKVLAVAVTIFAVAGVANAVNIIDGFNGLASMCVVMMLCGIGYVAFQAGDSTITLCALAGLGAVLGFFMWNFPSGLIFLGDGGAYFLGFYVAELSILLVQRNPSVSPLCPLLMCIYPIFETVFSIYRKKFLRGISPGVPDGIHLHMLVYKRLMRWSLGLQTAKALTRRNSFTSPYLWFLCMLAIVPSMLFWDNSAVLAGFIALFAATYTIVYRRIVRFRTPGWLVVRR